MDRWILLCLKFIQACLCRFIGCYLPFRARIGPDLSLPHSLHGVFVSQRAVLGSDVILFQNVTIGSDFDSRDPAKHGAPHVGDSVLLGAGAILIGRIAVGDGARIGAGAVVAKDVPPGGVAYAPRAEIRPPS